MDNKNNLKIKLQKLKEKLWEYQYSIFIYSPKIDNNLKLEKTLKNKEDK